MLSKTVFTLESFFPLDAIIFVFEVKYSHGIYYINEYNVKISQENISFNKPL
jgi:hypothetical protein